MPNSEDHVGTKLVEFIQSLFIFLCTLQCSMVTYLVMKTHAALDEYDQCSNLCDLYPLLAKMSEACVIRTATIPPVVDWVAVS